MLYLYGNGGTMKPWAYYTATPDWQWLCAKPECLVLAKLNGLSVLSIGASHLWVDNLDKCMYCKQFINKPASST